MDHQDPTDLVVESRAEAALELLRSLAKAGEDPEQFAQACRDWSRLSDDVESLPEFQSVLSMLTAAPADGAAPAPYQTSETEGSVGTFTLDPKGHVSSLTRDVANQLDLQIGDALHPSITPTLATEVTKSGLLVERTDRFDIPRQIKVYPKYQDGVVTGYTGQVFLFQLSRPLRTHLVERFGLTLSEIEILALLLRRHRLGQVAELRGIKLNTVRTHIARLNSKLGCHSITEAVSMTIELSQAVALRSEPLHILAADDESTARRITLPNDNRIVEYRRYGPAQGVPVIMLHSLEYGYLPSKAMIDAARLAGLNLIFPIRPGFGDTSPVAAIPDAAKLLDEFIRVLDLEDVIVVGLSTAAPLALELQNNNARISKTVLVNYGLDVADKISAIQPRWIGGLLRMAMSSSASFAFGVRTLNSMNRTFGGSRFYRMLYRSQDSDLAYLEGNLELFQIMTKYMRGADVANVRLDIQTAFLANPDAKALLSSGADLMVINGSDQHGVGPEKSRTAAERLNLDFRQVDHPGRNWMFQHPEALFEEIMS